MAEFFVRVEMHGASGEDYERLHKAMLGAGFFMAIQGADGSKLKLPTAEYCVNLPDPSTSASAVRDFVKPIADRVRAGSWVLAVKADDWAIHSKSP